MINRDANRAKEEEMVMPVHPYDCQTGPKKIEERLPPPMQNKMYIEEALPIETLPKTTPSVPEATMVPVFNPILLRGDIFAMYGNIDAGTMAAPIPTKAMLTKNKLKFSVHDENNTAKDNKSVTADANLGKLNMSAAGPRKKKETVWNSETTLNEYRALVISMAKEDEILANIGWVINTVETARRLIRHAINSFGAHNLIGIFTVSTQQRSPNRVFRYSARDHGCVK